MTTKTTPTRNGSTDTNEVSIRLRRLDRVTYDIPIIGETPLIVNQWSEKAKAMMLDKQQSAARKKKTPKDPEALYQASKYLLDDGRDGFPATAFKAAIVHAGRLFDGITQVQLKQTILVKGDGSNERGDELLALDYDNERMREDTPRNASGVADLRYRAMYTGWSTVLHVHTIAGQMDLESMLALVDAAGTGGVGEWRPTAPKSATGTYGTFRVDNDKLDLISEVIS